jgi:hypothetical protein
VLVQHIIRFDVNQALPNMMMAGTATASTTADSADAAAGGSVANKRNRNGSKKHTARFAKRSDVKASGTGSKVGA